MKVPAISTGEDLFVASSAPCYRSEGLAQSSVLASVALPRAALACLALLVPLGQVGWVPPTQGFVASDGHVPA